MQSLASFPSAERLGAGRYLISTVAVGAFALGDSPSAMVIFQTGGVERFYVTGPVYYYPITEATCRYLPDGVNVNEGGPVQASASPVGGGKLPTPEL